jgi:hypothetical protein
MGSTCGGAQRGAASGDRKAANGLRCAALLAALPKPKAGARPRRRAGGPPARPGRWQPAGAATVNANVNAAGTTRLTSRRGAHHCQHGRVVRGRQVVDALVEGRLPGQEGVRADVVQRRRQGHRHEGPVGEQRHHAAAAAAGGGLLGGNLRRRAAARALSRRPRPWRCRSCVAGVPAHGVQRSGRGAAAEGHRCSCRG